MYFDDEDERDPFEAFGEAEASDEIDVQEFDRPVEEPTTIEPAAPKKVKTGFSWAGFLGGVAALLWIVGAIGGPLSYFGVDAVMAMDPAMQAGMIALAFGPALLFWVAASAAGEALKARRLAMELTRIAQERANPVEAGEADAQRLTNTVKTEIEALNEAVSTALDRLAELERSAQRNAVIFEDAVAASREGADTMADALKTERDALVELNGELKGQTETMANTIGRQIRLMREASKLVKTEITAAEDALESHLASFAASATIMGERTAEFHQVANDASAATTSLNGAMSNMLEGLTEATRLTETARKSTAEAVMAANETAGAVRETTRAAVFEAKRAAQLIRAETVALQEAAAETLAQLKTAAISARIASEEGQAAAVQHAHAVGQRFASGGAKKSPRVERAPRNVDAPEANSLHAAANAAVARSSRTAGDSEPRRSFKGFGSWSNFAPQRTEEPVPQAANESSLDLVEFGQPEQNLDRMLQAGAIALVTKAGVDLGDVLDARDLERIARNSREGASARRRAVVDAAPGAVGRISRHVKRNSDAQNVATQFRARPDLAKSETKGEGSDLVRAYLLIDAALA